MIGVSMTLAAAAASMSLGEQPASNPQVASAAPVTQQFAPSNIAAQAAPSSITAIAPPAFPPIPAFATPSQPPLYAPAETQTWQPPQRECRLAQRKFYVAGNGTIRIYAGDYASRPVTLGPYPQEVALPAPRPGPGEVAVDRVYVEGQASAVVMTTDVPEFRQVYKNLRGSSYFDVKWLPLRNC